MEETKIFIAYAHDDDAYFKAFQKGIASHSKFSKKLKWKIWSDKNIPVGALWHEVIQEEIQDCDAAILLVSANFLSSDYIEYQEFKKFLEKSEKDGFPFFPILLCDCDITQWKELSARQFFLPKGSDYGKPAIKDLSYSYLCKFSETDNQLIPNADRDKFHKDCVFAIEEAIKLNSNKKKLSKTISKTNEIPKPENQSQTDCTDIEERFKDFQSQVMNHIKLQNDKIDSLEKTVSFLIDEAYNGLQPKTNHLLITFDKENRKYSFEFEKQFEIIATEVLPIRYETQFYANKYLTNGEVSKKFYEENKIQWTELEVGASISISNDNGKTFGEDTEVIVNPKMTSGNFIPFDICFESKDEKTVINLETGNIIKIKYWYSVPIFYWGSYINRHRSYFNEPLIVEIEYDKKTTKIIDQIEKLVGPKSTPAELSSDKYTQSQSLHNKERKDRIEFWGDRFEKFRITWDSEAYFGKDEFKTVDGNDESGRTTK